MHPKLHVHCVDKADWILVRLPVDVTNLDKLKVDPRDEGHPRIRIMSRKFELSAPEEPHHKFDLGIIPLLEVEGLVYAS